MAYASHNPQAAEGDVLDTPSSRTARSPRCLKPLALALALSALPPGSILAQDRPDAPTAPTATAAPTETTEVTRALEVREAQEAELAERHIAALEAAEAEQRAALEAVEAARQELLRRSEVEKRRQDTSRAEAEALRAEAERTRERSRELRRLQQEEARRGQEENRAIQRELQRAHENLRRASQEVARVHRQLNRSEALALPAPRFGGNRAVIGVILGESTEDGVEVLGLSPDGPAERAGLQQGDVIVGLMGEPLAQDGTDARWVLSESMEAVEPGDELLIVAERGNETLELTVVAEEREPFSWQSVTRLGGPTAPLPPTAPSPTESQGLFVQRFSFPELDMDQLNEDMDNLRSELAQRRIIVDARDGDGEIIYDFEVLSDVGETAISGTNIWFGMPLTRGLEFAELDSRLGAYFDTDTGVLVLRAREDNALELESGDVILSVGGDRVERPGDVMRALRRAEAGTSLEMVIKRQQRDETLLIEIPENRFGMLFENSEFPIDSFLDSLDRLPQTNPLFPED
ncbi:MAG: PDZ domain-containing protein [Pseudomonadota bacterium]